MVFTIPDFLDELADQLEQRPNLAGATPPIKVVTYFPSPKEDTGDVIILGHTTNTEMEPAALGNRRYQQPNIVSSEIRVVRPGSGERVAMEARDRAALMLTEVHLQLKEDPPNVGDQTISAHIANAEMLQFPSESGAVPVRVCLIAFDINYEARV